MFDFLKSKEEPAKKDVTLCAWDGGYGQVKVCKAGKDIRFLSTVGTPISDFARTSPISNEQDLLVSLAVTYNGKKYYLGHNAIMNTRNGRLSLRQNKANTEDNRLKFMTSLALLTDEDEEEHTFDVISGLPVLEFKNQKDTLYNMIYNEGKPHDFIMHYGPKEVHKRLYCRNVVIISQGEGAYYSSIISDSGDLVPSMVEKVSGMVMVVDPGYKTTDIVSMDRGKYIEPLSDQLNKGVSQVHQEILRLIMERLNIKKELKDIDEIVRSKSLFYNRNTYDISSIIKDACLPYAEDIVENLYTISNDNLGSMQLVMITGGGAELIYPYVKEMLNDTIDVEKIPDAEFSNAHGYYKYGLLLRKQGYFDN